MATPLDELARRLERDPFFLACPLRVFAASADLEDMQLAAKLGCSPDDLDRLRLCRAPAGEPKEFQREIQLIADHFHLDADALMSAVRMGQALFRMAEHPGGPTLLAARDHEAPPEGNS